MGFREFLVVPIIPMAGNYEEVHEYGEYSDFSHNLAHSLQININIERNLKI